MLHVSYLHVPPEQVGGTCAPQSKGKPTGETGFPPPASESLFGLGWETTSRLQKSSLELPLPGLTQALFSAHPLGASTEVAHHEERSTCPTASQQQKGIIQMYLR